MKRLSPITIVTVIALGASMARLSFADPVSLSGIVRDSLNHPVGNAGVSLLHTGLAAVTDANGAFTITGNALGAIPRGRSPAVPSSPCVQNGVLHIGGSNPSQTITVGLRTLEGREIKSFTFTSSGGACSFDLKQYLRSSSPVVLTCTVNAVSHTLFCPGISSEPGSSQRGTAAGLPKSALAALDTLQITAARFLPCNRTLTSTSAADIQITLASSIDLGAGASLHGARPFPDDNPWNTPVDTTALDPNSANLIASIGLSASLHADFGTTWDGGPNGIPYMVVSGASPKLPVDFVDYPDESDPGPYPIPVNAPVEFGSDRHVLVIDRDNWILYELYAATPLTNSWSASNGAVFNLSTDSLRPAGWTSADAAGLPIFPGLVRYDEVVEQKAVNHALRFTIVNSRDAYVYPARHLASSKTDPNLPPMGMRVRLKASVDISGFPQSVQVILQALKKYGMIVADNGSNWYVSGAPDSRWSDDELGTMGQIKGSDFEVVKMGTVVTN